MNPLTKMALGLIGQLRPEPPRAMAAPCLHCRRLGAMAACR